MKSRIGNNRKVLLKQVGSHLIVIFTVCAASLVAIAQTGKEPAVVLTAADMSLLVDDLDPEARKKLAQSLEERKAFAKEIRALLALAEAAKADHYTDRPELRLQLELAPSFVIAQAYVSRAQAASAREVVSQAEVDAFLNEPGMASNVTAFIDSLRKDGVVVDDARRKQLSDRYAQAMIAGRKGIAAGLDRERKTQLDIMLHQARLLADAYVRDHAALNKTSDVEVQRYITSHPEVDPQVFRAKAEGVLKRARAGESFSSLARQYSEDEGSKERGGDLGWFGRGEMLKPFEDAVFGLRPGEISGVFETSVGFHVARLDDRRTQLDPQGKSVEQVRASHILILFKHEYLSEYDPARQALNRENGRKWINAIVGRGNVSVPEDFMVTAVAGKP